MSVKHYNEETDQWEILASNRAMDIAIKDSSSNYESNNVEGALKEIGSLSKANDIKITELDGRVQYIEEHGVIGDGSGGGGGGGTGSLPTITSQYDTEIVDANEDITIRKDYSSSTVSFTPTDGEKQTIMTIIFAVPLAIIFAGIIVKIIRKSTK